MIRKTKIIATIGPRSSSKKVLVEMISRGVNVCRLNFSHLSHEKAKKIISNKNSNVKIIDYSKLNDDKKKLKNKLQIEKIKIVYFD